MDIDKRIETTIDRVFRIWLAFFVVGLLYVIFNYPGWLILGFTVGAIIAYYLMMLVAGVWLGMSISQQDVELSVRQAHARELNRRLIGGDATEEELEHEGIAMGTITARSPEIIGKLADTDIHDWIEVMDPHSGKVERFTFRQRAQQQGDSYLLPNEEGKLFVVLDGLIYERST